MTWLFLKTRIKRDNRYFVIKQFAETLKGLKMFGL